MKIKNDKMKVQVWTYVLDTLIDIKDTEIPDNYDGNPYGNTAPFVLGSNQALVTDPLMFNGKGA